MGLGIDSQSRIDEVFVRRAMLSEPAQNLGIEVESHFNQRLRRDPQLGSGEEGIVERWDLRSFDLGVGEG